MKIYFSGEGEVAGQPEDLLGPSVRVMMTYFLSRNRKKGGLQPRFVRLVTARKKARKKAKE